MAVYNSSPHFVKLHLDKSKNNELNQHRFIYDNARHELNCCSDYSLFNLEHTDPDSHTDKTTGHERDYKAEIVGSCFLSEPAALDMPRYNCIDELERRYDFRVEVVDSCNGLVCLAFGIHDYYYSIFLWNPSTRKSRRLPIWGKDRQLGCFTLFGFGYDEINDDYKVAGIYFDLPNSKSAVKVYSSKSDCWRKIEDFPSVLSPVIDHAKFANGAIHWDSRSCDPPHPSIIASLNVNREKFEEVHLPRFEEVPVSSSLAVMGEYRWLICSYETRYEIWIMKESGEEESWTKLATFLYWDEASMYEIPPSKDSHSPTCISVDGHIVFKPSTKVHNSNDVKPGMKLEIRDCYQEVIYFESLVSPNL